MTAKKRTTILCALLALSVCGGWLLANRSEEIFEGSPKDILPSPQASVANVHADTGPIEQERAAPHKNVQAKESPLNAYNQLSNGRAFILEFWQKPEIGGRYYAGKVADNCATVINYTNLIDQTQPTGISSNDFLAASAAQLRLQQRCSQISAEELAAHSRARAAALAPPDKLSHLIDVNVASKRAGEIDEEKNAVANILATGDPLVIDELGSFLALRNSPAGSFYTLGKQKYSWERRDIVFAAFYLAPCELGLSCTSDPQLDIQCLSGAGCYADRQHRVSQEMLELDQTKVNEARELSRKISKAVRDQNVGFFFP